MTVLYERRGPVAHITLARSDAMNAMDRTMYRAVNDAFGRFNADEDARAAVFSSSNPEAFCAGADIKDLHRAMTDEGMSLEAFAAECDVFFEKPGGLQKPVIAAIHGHCAGEGMVMALFCDVRIAADDALFSLPEARIGVPSVNGTLRAVQVGNHGAAMELLLTGEHRDAEWARSAGLVNTVVPRDQLLATADRLAEAIAANGPRAVRIVRELGERALEQPFDELVRMGTKLRAAVEIGDTVDRQAAFINRDRETD